MSGLVYNPSISWAFDYAKQGVIAMRVDANITAFCFAEGAACTAIADPFHGLRENLAQMPAAFTIVLQ
jgi:hypothetical protein